MDASKHYVVGSFLNPLPDDDKWDEFVKATVVAHDRSYNNPNTVIGVWDEESRCVCVFINGEQFNAT